MKKKMKKKDDVIDIEKATAAVWKLLEEVNDPEIPVLSVTDLGVVRNVEHVNNGTPEGAWQISITPTYSGCPAIDMIAMQIKMAMLQSGYQNIVIKTVLAPAWTTDWMTEAGKQKLKAYGIAPPVGKSFDAGMPEDLVVACPQCNSTNTKVISGFSSTACKALFTCNKCGEPFDYFKCH